MRKLAGRERLYTPQLLHKSVIWRVTLYKIFKSVADYIECHCTGELNLESLMRDPIADHMNGGFMAEVGNLGALLADPRACNEAIK